MKNSGNSGTGFAISGLLAMLAVTSAQAIYPTFVTRNDAISTLGGAGTPTEFFWNTVLVIVGVLWIWSTYSLFRSRNKKIGSIAFYPAAVGFILVGISPWNQFPLTHYLGAQLAFFFGALSCLVGSRIVSGAASKISVFAGVFSLAAYFSGYFGSDNILGPGGIERMIYYPILLWAIVFGGYLIGVTSTTQESALSESNASHSSGKEYS